MCPANQSQSTHCRNVVPKQARGNGNREQSPSPRTVCPSLSRFLSLPGPSNRRYSENEHSSIMTDSPDKPQFLLLLRQPNAGPAPTAEEMRLIMGRFTEWMASLSARGMVVGTNGLETTGTVLRRATIVLLAAGR